MGFRHLLLCIGLAACSSGPEGRAFAEAGASKADKTSEADKASKVGSEPGKAASAKPSGASTDGARTIYDEAAYRAALGELAVRREALAAKLRAADKANDDDERARVRREARAVILAALDTTIFPAWMGTPWSMGAGSTASMPHESGKTVGCSYFVTGALMNAGLKLDSRRTFAQAAALHIQRSLAPHKDQLTRFLSIPAPDMAEKVASFPDGLYLIGLRNHVGFVRVQDGAATFIHSGPSGPSTVQSEPLGEAPSVIYSRPSGYFVTPVFADGNRHGDALIDDWLRGRPVRFRRATSL